MSVGEGFPCVGVLPSASRVCTRVVTNVGSRGFGYGPLIGLPRVVGRRAPLRRLPQSVYFSCTLKVVSCGRVGGGVARLVINSALLRICP